MRSFGEKYESGVTHFRAKETGGRNSCVSVRVCAAAYFLGQKRKDAGDAASGLRKV